MAGPAAPASRSRRCCPAWFHPDRPPPPFTARRGLGLIEGALRAVERLMRQRPVFAGLLEPIHRQHRLIRQPLLGTGLGVRRLRATGQHQQRGANRRAEGEFPCLFSCHRYLSRFYSCGLSSSISISNWRRILPPAKMRKEGAATSGTKTLAVSGKGANRVCRAASKARACPGRGAVAARRSGAASSARRRASPRRRLDD